MYHICAPFLSFIQEKLYPAMTWMQFILTLQHGYYTEMKNINCKNVTVSIYAMYLVPWLQKIQPQIWWGYSLKVCSITIVLHYFSSK